MRGGIIGITALVSFFVILAGMGGVATAAEDTASLSLDEVRAMRKEAAHRKRRIVFDNDGNEPVYYCDEATPKALLDKRTTLLAGSQVDTIVYCTWSSGFSYFTHNTKVGAIFNSTAEEPGKGPGSGFSKNKTQAFIDQGTDPLEIVVDWCRKNEVEVFWSMRMNDVHDAWGAWYSPHLFPPLKQEHPEWLLGTKEKRPVNGGWTAVDFGRSEVRDLAFRFIEEVCTNYDVDGVQLDFFRHLNYFRNPSMGKPASDEELGMMTDLMRRVRAMADEVGAKRGRPILISVRVPDSVELCKLFGFDVARWMNEDLIDIMTVSGYFRLNPWETSVAAAHEHDVPVWACISESRFKDAEAKKVRASTECYRGRAANVWASGMDSVYMFNFFNPASPLWNEIGEPDTLAPLDKVFTTATRGYGNVSFWYEGGEKLMNRDIVEPAHPWTLEPGATETVTLLVGESVPADRRVTLKLRFGAVPESVTVTVNGKPVGDVSVSAGWMACRVSPNVVKKGENAIALAAPADGGRAQSLLDLQLWVQAEK